MKCSKCNADITGMDSHKIVGKCETTAWYTCTVCKEDKHGTGFYLYDNGARTSECIECYDKQNNDRHICAGSTVSGTDAIEDCIEYQKTHSMSYGGHGHTAKQAKQELTALTERIARAEKELSDMKKNYVDDTEADAAEIAEKDKRIATLEQQVEQWQKNYNRAIESSQQWRDMTSSEREQQAEKRGWDLHEANHGSTTPAGNTYEQAVAERDGGSGK